MKIVVGYIKSAEGRAALNSAIAEARLRQGELVVVHSMRGGERDEETQVHTYRDEFEAVSEQLAAEGIDFRIRESVQGRSPAEDLVAISEEESADLIVIGLRRRTPVGKLLLGSNAQDILLTAHCPVLAVKADEE